jgi:poly-gamma-glutamate capsule biosynthesis protein CapA/YwtB (metallophosphatase superfamily)
MYIQDVAEKQGYDYLFDRVRPFLQGADLTYANFEGNANPNVPRSDYPNFNYNPAIATALKNAGVDVVSTANNHAIDTGPSGIDATLDSLDKAGLLHHGTTRRNQPHQPYQLLTFNKNGVEVKAAFLSYTYGTNGVPDPYDQVNYLWNAQGKVSQAVKDAIAQARQETDLVIVAVHWGIEYQQEPTDQQTQGAQDLAAAGADIILGDHPHTVEPVAWLDNGGRKSLVIYSLGNFVAAQNMFQAESFTQASLIYYVGFNKDKDGKVTVSGYRYLPVFIENDLRPAPIVPNGPYAGSFQHIQAQLRDPNKAHLVGNDPAAIEPDGIQVCNSETFAETGQSIGGDFYDYFYTLGSGQVRLPSSQAIAIIGYPIKPVVYELSGDCQRTVPVLYTERQRLELHQGADWPFRVVGTQLGTAVYRQKYHPAEIVRNTDIDGSAIANPRFKAFFQRYGGLTVFGYPISPALTETDETTGQTKTVQYFERARMELTPGETPNPNPLYDVQLGLLGHEYAGINAQCGSAASVDRLFQAIQAFSEIIKKAFS